MKKFKNSKRYLAFALTFLMPIYANFELLAGQNKEKIEVIKNKEEAKEEIKKLVNLITNAEENKDYKNAIKFLKKGIEIEKNIYGENHPYLADSYNWLGEI